MDNIYKYSLYIEVAPFSLFRAGEGYYKNSEEAIKEARKLAIEFYQSHEGTNGLISKAESDLEFMQLYPEKANDEVEKLDYYYQQIVNSIYIEVFPEGILQI